MVGHEGEPHQVTALGTQAIEVALLVQAKQLTGSPLEVGLLGVAELVPLVVFGLYGGVLADRFDRRALMRWGEAGQACCAVLLLVDAPVSGENDRDELRSGGQMVT